MPYRHGVSQDVLLHVHAVLNKQFKGEHYLWHIIPSGQGDLENPPCPISSQTWSGTESDRYLTEAFYLMRKLSDLSTMKPCRNPETAGLMEQWARQRGAGGGDPSPHF